MDKRFLLIIWLSGLIVLGGPLRAEEKEKSGPSISLSPLSFDLGKLTSDLPVVRSVTVNNFGKSLLYISKIKYT
jgi:hypothetical protein